MTPDQAILLCRLERSKRTAVVSPVLAEVVAAIEADSAARHKRSNGASRSLCTPAAEAKLRRLVSDRDATYRSVGRAMDWSPMTVSKHCARLGLVLGV